MKNTIQKPLTFQCFKCNNDLIVKWNGPRNQYVTKNNGDYGTENIAHKELKICNDCIKKIHSEDRYQFLSEIRNPKKRLLLRNYIKAGLI